jgi:hypothetical protein
VIFISKQDEWEPQCGDYLGDMTDELSDKIGQDTITPFIGEILNLCGNSIFHLGKTKD